MWQILLCEIYIRVLEAPKQKYRGCSWYRMYHICHGVYSAFRGRFGEVHVCTEKATGMQLVAKVLKGQNEQDRVIVGGPKYSCLKKCHRSVCSYVPCKGCHRFVFLSLSISLPIVLFFPVPSPIINPLITPFFSPLHSSFHSSPYLSFHFLFSPFFTLLLTFLLSPLFSPLCTPLFFSSSLFFFNTFSSSHSSSLLFPVISS